MKTRIQIKQCGFIGLFLSLLAGCASGPGIDRRVVLDSSPHRGGIPEWVESTKVSFERDQAIVFKSFQTIKGNERVSGCFDLARLNAKEALLSEIANEIRGSLDSAQQSLSENAELILGKVRTGEFHGTLTGLRFTEQYYERYRITETERVDCYTLSEIKKSDYNLVKASIINGISLADPRIKEAITNKQIDFFKSGAVREALTSAVVKPVP